MYNFLNTFQRSTRNRNQNRPQGPRPNTSMVTPRFFLSSVMRNRGPSQMRMVLPHGSSFPASSPSSTPPDPTFPQLSSISSFDFDNPIFTFDLEESNIDVLEMMYQIEQNIIRESKIYANTTPVRYGNKKNKIKNDMCPILQTSFEENTIVSWFLPCHHAIDLSTFEKFVSHFSKCPLCNTPLAV